MVYMIYFEEVEKFLKLAGGQLINEIYAIFLGDYIIITLIAQRFFLILYYSYTTLNFFIGTSMCECWSRAKLPCKYRNFAFWWLPWAIIWLILYLEIVDFFFFEKI